jgi:hypothetical protein
MSPPRPLLQAAVFRSVGLPLPPLKQPQKPQKTGIWCTEQPDNKGLPEKRVEKLSALSAKFVDPSQRLLSVDEIRRWLLRFRHDQTFQEDGLRVPYTELAKFAGINRDTLYVLLRTQRVALLTRIKLTPVIKAIEAGRLRFIQDKQTQKWTWKTYGPPLWRHESGRHDGRSARD